ncbi:3-deoxy-8-phosphooctulonate synthase [Mesobacillus subterraneus]|uniref:3-deoxy-8-phosphooctulonate synthase n=1 Tax=Mesobacillus subterraneus TaxID=285983 RepID=UPI00273E167F|nr:3-deoxy-8-phosphooctulonate synthase [Mesobacillus subterraneus]WLR55580.1 3-deoxy-8-phosphooctulonate synthase [Mesobacillus subterraneus]
MMKTSILSRLKQIFGRKVYHRNPLILETETDGFIYGEITDHFDFDEEEGCTFGDGFVQAPNGSRAGLIWAVSDEPYLKTCIEPEDGRWGVYNVGFVKPIKTMDDLKCNFKTVLPMIKEAYNKAERGK